MKEDKDKTKEQLEVRSEDLKTALGTLQVSEERFRHLTELIGDWVWEIDRDVVFTYASPGVKTILGYEPEEVVGKRSEDFMTEAEARSFGTEFWKSLVETRQPMLKVRNIMRHKDGHQVVLESSAIPFYDEDGRLLGYRGLDRDITERERIENEMRFLSSVTQQVTDSIVITDTSYRITYVNQAAENLFGYRTTELIGKSPKIFNAEPDIGEVQKGIHAKISVGETWFGELRNKRKDGSTFQCEFKVSPLHDEQGQVISYIGVQRDVTERRHIQEALLASEARLNEAQSIAHIGSWDWDVMKNEINHSAEFERVMGRSVSDFEVFLDCIHPDDREYVEKFISAALRAGSPYEIDYRVSLPGGEERVIHEQARVTLDDSGQAIRMAGTVQDITERKKAEEALNESEEQYRTLYEEAPNAYLSIGADGRIRRANTRAVELLGYRLDELIGRSVLSLYADTPDGKAKAQAVFQKFLAGEETYDEEIEMCRADGNSSWISLTVKPIFDNKGKVVASRSVLIDITKRKQAEEEKRSIEQKAYLSGRLASIGQMASGIAHELNNPLTGVLGYSQSLLREDVPDDIKRRLGIIMEGAKRTVDIVARLLTFARQQKPERRYIDINEIIESVLALRSYQLETSNIKLKKQLALDLPKTMADAGQIQQVFLNLIINAETEMRRTHGGGHLFIKTEVADGRIRISIEDDGPGIAEQDMERIFEPFFTTREPGKGMGLGLSLCHGIVSEHRGRIYAQSISGEGAIFFVELPIVIKEGRAKKDKPKRKINRASRARILVVDDEPVIRQLMSEELSELGYGIDTAESAGEVLYRIQNGDYDLILLDVKLPDMSGTKLYRIIEKSSQTLIKKIVFMTGDVMGLETRDFLEKTKAPYIAKPFTVEQVNEKIIQFLSL